MHPQLLHLSFATLHTVIGDEAKARELLSDIGVLPKKDDVLPKCPKCGLNMKADSAKNHLTGFRWRCIQKTRGKCYGHINPTINTFLYNAKVAIQDILFIIIFFIWKRPVLDCMQHLNAWRKHRGQLTVSNETIYDWYCYCQEVAEIHASHNSQQLGGAGKSIVIFKTLLTRRKNRADIIPVTNVFGTYCQEDKEGFYFLTNEKSKKELRLLVEKHCHPDSKVTYSDDAVQTAQKNIIDQHMVLRFYRRFRFKNLSLGEKVQQFLEDIVAVYPGYKNGVKKEGLRMIHLGDLVKSEGTEQLIPKAEDPAVEPVKLIGYKNGDKENLKMIPLNDSIKFVEQLIPEPEEPAIASINLLDSNEISFIEESIVNDCEVMMEVE